MEVMPVPEGEEGGDVAYIGVKGVMRASGELMLVVLDVMVLPLPVDVAAAAGAWAGGRSLPEGEEGGDAYIVTSGVIGVAKEVVVLGSPLVARVVAEVRMVPVLVDAAVEA